MCGKGANTTTQTTAPPPQVSQAYNSLMERAQGVSETPYTPYTGQRVADLTPDQLAAMGQITNMGNVAQPYISEGAGYMRDSANPVTQQALQPYMNPYQQSVIDATLARTTQADAQAQNQVTGNAALRGALGGDRMGIAQAELAGQQKLARDQTVAGLNQQNYTQALAAFQADQARKAQTGFGISSLGTVAQNAELARLQAALGIGNQQQQQNQAGLNVPYQNYLEERAYPFQTSQWLAQMLGASTPALGSTTTTTGPKPSPWNQILGVGTAALGAFTGNPFLIGAGVGGAMGGGAPMATGGRVGYADGGPLTPLPATAYPMNLNIGYVSPSQLRAMPMMRPNPMPQEQPEDPSMSRMTNNFVAAMKAMRGKEDDHGLSDYQATNSDGAHAHGGRVGYADGGGVSDVFNYYMPNPDTDTMTVMDRTWQRLSGNLLPPTNPEWNTPGNLEEAGLKPFVPWTKDQVTTRGDLQPTATRPDSTALVPVAEINNGSGIQGPNRTPSPTWYNPTTWSKNLSLPLITAGLGMMASKSPFVGQAIGEGGLMGVQTYMTQEQQARANELKKRQIELQSQRLAEAAERARETLGFRRDQQSALEDYRRDSLAVRQSPAARKGAIENIVERLAKERGITFEQAFDQYKSSNRDPQTNLALERLALQDAQKDPAFAANPRATLQASRKFYGLPDTPAVLKKQEPAPSTPPVTYPNNLSREEFIKQYKALVDKKPHLRDQMLEDFQKYKIDPSEWSQ